MSEKMHTEVGSQEATSEALAGSIIAPELDWEPEEEAAVRRKFDFTITPLVTIMYMLCAIDRYAPRLASQHIHTRSTS